jgi:hypothetical protein
VFVGLDPLQPCGDCGSDFDMPIEMSIHQRHLDQRQRLRVVVDDKQVDMAEIAAARGVEMGRL